MSSSSQQDFIFQRDKINFDELCGEFVRYYTEFDESYQRSVYHKGSTDPCYVTFGISGAGKSTTLARLLSNLSPSDFYALILDRDGEHKNSCIVEGITIGHSAVSATVVPKIYGVGKIQVCDMPGFAETNPQKKISIDVLQKCFLTRVQFSKFLVVADIGCIDNAKCETLMQHYHKPLLALLGAQYEASIEHLYFVLTKNQKLRYNSGDVKLRLSSVAMDILDDNPVGARFLKRLTERHVIVDLEADSGSDLLAKINKMIELDRQQKVGLSKRTTWSIDKLEAGANMLNTLSLEHVASLRKRQDELYQRLPELEEAVSEKKAEFRLETAALELEQQNAFDEFDKATNALTAIKSEIAAFEPSLQQCDDSIKEITEIKAVHEKQSQLFRTTFIETDFITFRCDLSKKTTRMGSTKYTTSINADLTSDGSDERLILVMEYEGGDETLKKFVNRGGSIVPESLKSIRDIDAVSVLYNSHRNINRCKATWSSRQSGMDGTAVVCSLEISRDKPFKVYIYAAHKFKKLKIFDTFQAEFDKELVRDQERIDSLHLEADRLKAKHEDNLRAKRETEELIDALKDNIDKIKSHVKSTHKLHRNGCADLVKTLKEWDEQTAMCKDDEKIEQINEIDNIFRANQIVTELSSPLEELKARFIPLQSKLRELVGVVERFDRDDDEQLMDIAVARETV